MIIFRVVISCISYLLTGFLLYCLNDINKSLVLTINTNNSLQLLGLGISKIFLIPIIIVLYLILFGCLWSTLINSIRLLRCENKTLKVFGILLLIINIGLIVLSVYFMVMFFKIIF